MGWKKKDKIHSLDYSERPPVSLAEMMSSGGPRAVCLYFGLLELASRLDVAELTMTRKEVGDVIGVTRLATVSECLKNLAIGSWIVKDVFNQCQDDNVTRLIVIRFHRQFAEESKPEGGQA